jgi:hypothetical protein
VSAIKGTASARRKDSMKCALNGSLVASGSESNTFGDVNMLEV